LASKNKYHFIKEPLAKYRVHSGNVFRVENKYRILRDQIIIMVYILERHSKIMTKEIIWAKSSELINTFFNYGKPIHTRPYIIKNILLNPFKKLNYWYFLKSHIRLPIFEKFFKILIETPQAQAIAKRNVKKFINFR